ncbi:MAG TPA: tetratricopeptide repeat protein [Blastocatellia bacterium]|nr:tetratricopeptide repeat protein [Blastocatellia bacterium]
MISLFAALAYANSLDGRFVFDDIEQIVENKDIRSWGNIARGFTTHVWAFREPSDSLSTPLPLPYYRPIFTTALTVGYHVFGLWPPAWHLASLLLHTLCSVGVFYMILLLSRRRLVAFISSLLFAVYPVHAESVCWISGMTDPLFSLFYLASFCMYLSYRGNAVDSDGKSWGGRSSVLAGSLTLFALAAFSKETALSLVLLVFGYELVEASGRWSKRLVVAARRATPHFAVAILYLIPRYLALQELMWSNPQAPSRPFSLTLLTLPSVVCSYLFHLVWPVGLSVTYQTRFITAAASPEFIIPAGALVIGIGALVAFRARVRREVMLGLLLIFIPLLPVLNLGQVSQEEYLVFDHYLYLPVAGWAYLVALALERFIAWEGSRRTRREKDRAASGLSRLRLGGASALVLVVGLTIVAALENRAWSDSYSLWSNAARVRPRYWAPHYNAGLALLDMGRAGDARGALETAAELAPDEPTVFDALGRAHDAAGDTSAAVTSFKRALELDPSMFASLNNLGTAYFNAGDYASAEREFGSALRQNPQSLPARFNLARSYSARGRYADAIREFERVISEAPTDSEAHYYLGIAYEGAGRNGDAERSLERAASTATSQAMADKVAEELKNLRESRH